MINQKKNIVIIGTGSVGLGLLAPKIYEFGYNPILISTRKGNNLQRSHLDRYKNGYHIIDSQNGKCTLPIFQMFGIEEPDVYKKICNQSDIWITAVGTNNLNRIAKNLSDLIDGRVKENRDLCIVLCENIPLDSEIIHDFRNKLIKQATSYTTIKYISEKVNLFESINYSVVPGEIKVEKSLPHVKIDWEITPIITNGIIPNKDYPNIFGNNKLFLSSDDFEYEKKLKFYIQLHCYEAVNYLGFTKGFLDMKSALKDKEINTLVHSSLNEITVALYNKYPSMKKVICQKSKQMKEFLAKAEINDNISRNCRNPHKKLCENERLVGPALLVQENNGNIEFASKVIASAIFYGNELWKYQNNIEKISSDFQKLVLKSFKHDLVGGISKTKALEYLASVSPNLEELVRCELSKLIESRNRKWRNL